MCLGGWGCLCPQLPSDSPAGVARPWSPGPTDRRAGPPTVRQGGRCREQERRGQACWNGEVSVGFVGPQASHLGPRAAEAGP